MKRRIAWLTILCLMLAAMPAAAQVLYDDGPIKGTMDAWTINFGYIVSDTFSLLNNSTVTGLNFGVWEFPGDTLTSVDWSITSETNGGVFYGSGTASGRNLTDQFISINQYGYDIDKITVTGLNVNLTGAIPTYWLNLQNAVVPSGNPVFWDENSGIGCKGDDGKGAGCPSEAVCGGCIRNYYGNIPPESFDINGSVNGGTTPEPSSFMLLGSGVLVSVGVLRRRLL
jgi:PEP-CTERM motif